MPPNNPAAYLNGLKGGDQQRLNASGQGVPVSGAEQPMNLMGDAAPIPVQPPMPGPSLEAPPPSMGNDATQQVAPQSHPTTDMLLQGMQEGDPEAMRIIRDVLDTFMQNMEAPNETQGLELP